MNQEIGNDEEPGESRTITVRWKGEQNETANEFIRSLGFDPRTWEGEGTCELASDATFKAFGMDLPLSRELLGMDVWECHTEKRAEGVHLLVINDVAVAANCRNLTDLTPLSGLTQLTGLDLCGCESLTDLTPLSGLTQLTSLHLSFCRTLTADLTPLSGLTQLTMLDLSYCSSLADISPLARLTQLTRLDLSHCSKLTDISPLAGLTRLTRLNLEGAGDRLQGPGPLSALSELKQLNHLVLSNPESDLTPLAGLTKLTDLFLSYSGAFNRFCRPLLSDISPLSRLTRLTSLGLVRCRFLTDLSPLAELTRLVDLRLDGCESLTDLTPLLGLNRLQSLDLEGCLYLMREDKLTALSPLRDLCEVRGAPPNFVLSVLLGAAISRNDSVTCASLLGRPRLDCEWRSEAAPEILAKGQNPDLAVTAARACRCAGESLDPAIPAALLDTTLGLSTVAPEHWGEILGELSQKTSALLESWLDALAAGDASESFLAGFLDRVASGWCLPGWQPEHLAGRLDHWLEARAAAELSFLGPRICLAWRRLGRPDREQAWLERLTDPADPSFRDRVRAAFALADIEHGRRAEAAGLLREIQHDAVADPVRVSLARALAADAPEEAGRWLEEIDDARLRADLATELGGKEDFRAVEENLRRLLVILGTDPDRFLELLSELAGRDPDHAWLIQLRDELLPRPEGPGFVEQILARLDLPVVAEMTKPRQLQQLKQSLAEDPAMLERACDELVVGLLETGGLIDDDEAADLRSSLGNGAAD